MATPAPAGHRRNKSSVLKSIVLPGHRRMQSDLAAQHGQPYAAHAFAGPAPLLPPDHPHAALKLLVPAPPPASPTREPRPKSLHKKTLSSVSLRSLGRDRERERERERVKDAKSREPSRTRTEDMAQSPTKTKSKANLRGFFSKDRQAHDVRETRETRETRDKENTAPTTPSDPYAPLHTPIWAEFSSQPLHHAPTATKMPLNDQQPPALDDDDAALYASHDYSPSKGRNFFDHGLPSLQKKPQPKERPKSFLETLTRKRGDARAPLGESKGNGGRPKSSKGLAPPPRPPMIRASTDSSRETIVPKKAPDAEKRQSRVMAAVAAFNGKSKQSEKNTSSSSPTKLDPKVVDAEFEAVLVSLVHLTLFQAC